MATQLADEYAARPIEFVPRLTSRAGLARTLDFQRRVTSLVLDGHGLPAIVDAVGASLGSEVLVLDGELSVVHRSSLAGDLRLVTDVAALGDAITAARRELVGEGRVRIELPDSSEAIDLTIAALEPAEARFVVVIASPTGQAGRDTGIEEAVVTAISLALMRERAAAETEARLVGGLFRTLFSTEDDEAFRRRAVMLGYDLAGPNVIVAVAGSAGPSDLRPYVQRSARLHFGPATAVFEHEQSVCVLLGGEAAKASPRRIADRCNSVADDLESFGGCRIALAGPHTGAAGVRRAAAEALHALDVLAVMGNEGRPVAFADLGIWTLLGSMGDRERLREFAQATLGRLVEHDERRQTQLLETVRALVACNFHHRHAAEGLFIHPNTLRYRLPRIAEITGLDFNRSDDRLQAGIALRVLDLGAASRA